MVETVYETLPINIEDELKKSYLDYAMSVIVGRALPDVRDGLKPVHRRVLFAMSVLNNDWNKPYKKSARVVGDVIGKYHPHGDSAVYDTIVRMAQNFSMRYLLVDGQGNFGSVDGDNAAAMRYTEVRMTKMSHQLLADLEKETVDFVPNYDGNETMPSVLPTRVPNLLVNGSSGIAVGMATNIPPHNMTEIVNACLMVLDNADVPLAQILEVVSGPDFPTGGIINGRAGILEAYKTGRGRIYVRAKAEVHHDDQARRDVIIVHELPYQVNKARLIEKIAELVKDKKIEGISEIRDESDKDGLRVVIELKRGESGEVLLNNLYSQTQLETVFGINMVALEDGQPKLFDLKEILRSFIRHRRTVVTRRTWHELKKARERGHVLEGLAVALANIDPVIQAIKTSPTPQVAKERLLERGWEPGDVIVMLEKAGDANMCRPDATEDIEEEYGMRDGAYYFSPVQVQQILDMRLNRLTGLEREKLLEEYGQRLAEIADLLDILSSDSRLVSVIREELEVIRADFGDERKTVIQVSRQDLDEADLIPEESVVVTISNGGYAKTQPLSVYQAQRRGGRGKSATSVKEEDFINHLLVCSSHDTILCFTDQGKVHWVRAFHIPQASRGSRGRPIVNVLSLSDDEHVTAILPMGELVQSGVDDGRFIFMATKGGTTKKVSLSAFSRPRNGGLIALDLDEGDHLVGVAITKGDSELMLVSSDGKAIRFHESNVRAMGRTARGVRGMKLGNGASIIALMVVQGDQTLLTASEHGYGKRSALSEFSTQGRGGRGVIAMQCSDRNGQLIGAAQVTDDHEVLLISDQGTMVRTECAGISVMGRNTQGVTLIRVQEGERLTGVVSFDEPEADVDDVEHALGEDVEGSVADDVGRASFESVGDVSGEDVSGGDAESASEDDVSE